MHAFAHAQGAWVVATNPTWPGVQSWLRHGGWPALLVLENAEAVTHGAAMVQQVSGVTCIQPGNAGLSGPRRTMHGLDRKNQLSTSEPCCVQDLLLSVVKQLHAHPRVRVLITSRVQPGAGLPALSLEALTGAAAVSLVMESMQDSSQHAYRWERWQAEQLATQCKCNALLLTIVTRLVASKRCTVTVSRASYVVRVLKSNVSGMSTAFGDCNAAAVFKSSFP